MSEFTLVPAPAVVTPGEGAFSLAGSAVCGPWAALLSSEFQTVTGLSIPVADDARIVLSIDGEGAAESYRLSVTPHGVRVTAADGAGLRYAVFTLTQLAQRVDGAWVLPAVEIEDAPRFRYRGFMLDTARHFFDVATVKKLIDRAARLKLNVLHLHLSDDQGWRIEIASRPELTVKASAGAAFGAPGGFYTKADYAEIVASDKVHQAVQEFVDRANESLERWETVKKFVILPQEFSVDEGEVTPSMKVRRSAIAKRFSDEIDSMYEREPDDE